LSRIFRIAVAAVLLAACAIPLGAAAQTSGKNSDSKHALAVRLAHLQQKTDGDAVAQQLTASAVQPLVAGWSQKLDETVPPARQQEMRAQLQQELEKFSDNTYKAIQAQSAKAAEEALVPIFMEKFSEDELKTLVAYQESPVAAKFMAMGLDATNAWAKQLMQDTRAAVESSAKTFDGAAAKIVAAPPSPPSAAASGDGKK
jgi:hypothetical protein